MERQRHPLSPLPTTCTNMSYPKSKNNHETAIKKNNLTDIRAFKNILTEESYHSSLFYICMY